MERRAFLAGAGIACGTFVGGCVEDAAPRTGGGEEPGSADDGNDDENGATGGFERRVSVGGIDDVPDEAPVDFRIRVEDETVSADETAFLEIAVTNTSDAEIPRVQTPYYKGSSASDGDPGILVYSLKAPDSPSREYTPNCIEDPEPTQEYLEWTDEGPLGFRLAPGDTETDELIVVDDPTVDGCFPVGEYRFDTAHTVDDFEFTWGFTVDVSK